MVKEHKRARQGGIGHGYLPLLPWHDQDVELSDPDIHVHIHCLVVAMEAKEQHFLVYGLQVIRNLLAQHIWTLEEAKGGAKHQQDEIFVYFNNTHLALRNLSRSIRIEFPLVPITLLSTCSRESFADMDSSHQLGIHPPLSPLVAQTKYKDHVICGSASSKRRATKVDSLPKPPTSSTQVSKGKSSQQGVISCGYMIEWEHLDWLPEGYDDPFSYLDMITHEKKVKAQQRELREELDTKNIMIKSPTKQIMLLFSFSLLNFSYFKRRDHCNTTYAHFYFKLIFAFSKGPSGFPSSCR